MPPILMRGILFVGGGGCKQGEFFWFRVSPRPDSSWVRIPMPGVRLVSTVYYRVYDVPGVSVIQ